MRRRWRAGCIKRAARLGLLEPADAQQIERLAQARRSLFELGAPEHPLTSLDQFDWAIRVLVLSDELTEEQRDVLARRLHATWTFEVERQPPYNTLEALLLITRLLEVIDLPLEIDSRRAEVHDWLRRCFSTEQIGFTPAGGFKASPSNAGPSLDATWHAIQLMKLYGIPADLEHNWVRSFLSPWSFRIGDRRLVAAASRHELATLPGLQSTTWLEALAAERVLIAVVLLACLCIYATASAPKQSQNRP